MDEELFTKPHSQAVSPSHGANATTMNAMAMNAMAVSLGAQITSVATRLKLAEDRYTNLSKRNQLTESSLLSFEREIKTELRVLTKQTVELRKHISEINTKMDMMLGELNTVVRKHEFTAVERYLDMWQPMSFITREQAKRIIEDMKSDSLPLEKPVEKDVTSVAPKVLMPEMARRAQK